MWCNYLLKSIIYSVFHVCIGVIVSIVLSKHVKITDSSLNAKRLHGYGTHSFPLTLHCAAAKNYSNFHSIDHMTFT